MFTSLWWTLFLLKFISVQSCSLVCFNDGYASSDCSHCVCPSGWTGLRCSSASPCGDVLKASAGYLTSPGFPEDYDRNRNCTWTFDSSLSPSVILLRIVNVDLSRAINDSLRITDRTQNLAVIYGSRYDFRSRDVIKVDSSVVIRFLSGSYVSFRRGFYFSLEYQVFPGIQPQFISTPNDTTILKGETLSFFCLSSGFPQPIVRWEKDGENVTRPEGSENGELSIQNANEATDSGLYDCIAENYLGSVRHQFFVAVHVPPVITHAPVDAVFEYYIPYEYVYFRCDAYGIPEPEIYWKKDGKFIPNPSYSSSASRWISVSVRSEEFGKYSCYVNNSVGAVESSSAVFSRRNASEISIYGNIYNSGSWVNTNSSVYFYMDFCCQAEIKIRKVFRDGILLNALKFEGLDTTFDYYQQVSFEYATFSDSGVYMFETLVLVNHRNVFKTFLYSYIHVKAFPRPLMFSPFKSYPFDPDESLLLVCTERFSHPRSSLQFFLNGVRMNLTGASHSIRVYDSRLYLSVRNLTYIFADRNNNINWQGDFGANFTCKATTTYFGHSKNTSVLISFPWHVSYNGYRSFWSLWSSSTQCSSMCDRNSGFLLRYRTCYTGARYSRNCYGGQNAVEACSSQQNCSSPSVTESPTVARNSTNITATESVMTRLPAKDAGELSAGVASAVTLAAVLVAMSALAIIIGVIFKKKKMSFCQLPRVEADRSSAPQASAANAYSSRPAILEAKMKSNKSRQNVSLNVAVGEQEMTALPVYEDVQDSSPEKKDKIKWTTTSLYETVNVPVTVESDASD